MREFHRPGSRQSGGAARKRLSYANVASTLALVIALGGGTAWAAHTYLITSTGQIKPSVLKKLQGRSGKNGTNLTSQTPLPSGQSESGFYAAAGGYLTGSYVATAITYAQPLATPIANADVIWNLSGTTSPNCPGIGQAGRGYLCLYDNEQSGLSDYAYDYAFYSTGGPATPGSATTFSTPSWGAILYWTVTGGGGYVSGEYTVTAP
jgi:hypothetical protein